MDAGTEYQVVRQKVWSQVVDPGKLVHQTAIDI
jgi:hypothetical protein